LWDTLYFLLFVIWIQARNTRRKSLELAASLQGWVLCRLPFCAQYRVPNWSGVDDFLSIECDHSSTTLTKFCPLLTTYLLTPDWQWWRNVFTFIRGNLHTVDISSSQLPSSSCQRSLWMTPWTNLVVYGNQFVTLHKHAIIHTTTLCLLGYMIWFSYLLDVMRISGKKEDSTDRSWKIICYIFQFRFWEEQNSEIIFSALSFPVKDDMNFVRCLLLLMCYPSHHMFSWNLNSEFSLVFISFLKYFIIFFCRNLMPLRKKTMNTLLSWAVAAVWHYASWHWWFYYGTIHILRNQF
jgi:hypothetical protein